MTAAPRRRWSPFDRFWRWNEKRLIELYGPNGEKLQAGSNLRRFRFGLRTMLVLIAIVCAPLGFVARENYEIRKRERWLERIEKNHLGYLLWQEGHRNFLPPNRRKLTNWLRNGDQHSHSEREAQKVISIPWLRMQMGYRPVMAIGLKDASELEEVQRLFPEVETIFWDEDAGQRAP